MPCPLAKALILPSCSIAALSNRTTSLSSNTSIRLPRFPWVSSAEKSALCVIGVFRGTTANRVFQRPQSSGCETEQTVRPVGSRGLSMRLNTGLSKTLVGTARKGRYGHRSQRHSVHADKQPGLKWHHDVQYRQLGDIAGNRPHATRWG
jgi:hypothetical protein